MGDKSCLLISVIILAEIVQLGVFYYTSNITVSNIIGAVVMFLWILAICVMIFSMFESMKNKLRIGLPVSIAASIVLLTLIASGK